MLPTMHLFDGRVTAQVVRIGAKRLYFSFHDDCATCRSLIAFQVDGERPIVCDISAKKGGTYNTALHRRKLEPDVMKWLSPSEFARKWMELHHTAVPFIHHFGRWFTAVAVTIGSLRLHFTFDRGFWPDLIAFRLHEQPVVCDLSNWRGGPARTAQHRLLLEPERTRWHSPIDFHRRWMEEASAYLSHETRRLEDDALGCESEAEAYCGRASCGC